MEAKNVRDLMGAYASIYEEKGKKSDCVDKEDKGAHNCAKKVCHEEFGEGTCIFGHHAIPDENGFVSHYDVIFEHGVEKNVPVSEMEVLISESHMKEGHHYEGEQLDEFLGSGAATMVDKATKAVQGGLQKLGVPINKTERPTTTQAQQQAKVKQNVKEEDLFDLIKGHLISEGYADSEETALKIMTSMSESWKESIIEQSAIGARAAKVVDDQRQGYHGDSDAINKLRDDLSRSMGRLKKGQGPVVTPGLPGV